MKLLYWSHYKALISNKDSSSANCNKLLFQEIVSFKTFIHSFIHSFMGCLPIARLLTVLLRFIYWYIMSSAQITVKIVTLYMYN